MFRQLSISDKYYINNQIEYINDNIKNKFLSMSYVSLIRICTPFSSLLSFSFSYLKKNYFKIFTSQNSIKK